MAVGGHWPTSARLWPDQQANTSLLVCSPPPPHPAHVHWQVLSLASRQTALAACSQSLTATGAASASRR
jgi:hypothetical protein